MSGRAAAPKWGGTTAQLGSLALAHLDLTIDLVPGGGVVAHRDPHPRGVDTEPYGRFSDPGLTLGVHACEHVDALDNVGTALPARDPTVGRAVVEGHAGVLVHAQSLVDEPDRKVGWLLTALGGATVEPILDRIGETEAGGWMM